MIFNRFDTGRQRRGGERLGKTDLIGIATPLRTLAIVGLDLAPASLSHRPRGISGISRFFLNGAPSVQCSFSERTDGVTRSKAIPAHIWKKRVDDYWWLLLPRFYPGPGSKAIALLRTANDHLSDVRNGSVIEMGSL